MNATPSLMDPVSGLQVTDPQHDPVEAPNAFQRFFLARIRDERDLPFVHFAAALAAVQIPFAILMFSPWGRWWMAIPYALFMARYAGSFTLMLHNTSHRRLFKREHDWMNRLIPWVVGPLMGQTPETYVAHHIGMHHPENNLGDDLSTTMPYRRDSLLGFAHYFFSFLFLGPFLLPLYHRRKGRTKMFKSAMYGELIGWAFIALVTWLNPLGGLTIFLIPTILVRFAMMAGNWGQHAFVDPDDPSNPYKNSITCINTHYNHFCFNDGYHAGHHVKQTRHWTEMPADFIDKADEFRANDGVVFRDIDHFMVWVLLMAKRWDVLVDKFVDLRAEPRSKEEIRALLEHRVQPISVR